MNSEKNQGKKYNMFRRKPQNSKYSNQGNIILAIGGGGECCNFIFKKRHIIKDLP